MGTALLHDRFSPRPAVRLSPAPNYNLPVVGVPDGGAFSTAADMARFWSGLHSDLILGSEWRECFLRPHVSAGPSGLTYGLGVWIHERPDEQAFPFLEGADAGVTFNSLHHAESGIEYTVACNAPPGATELVKLLDGAILEVGTG